MKNALILVFITLFVAFACKKDNFEDQMSHNYTLKDISAEDVEEYMPNDTNYIKETFVDFNNDMEDYREDSQHPIDEYHIFDAYWLLASNLIYEYGHIGDTFCPDTTATFTISVDIVGIENDTPMINGQSMADEIIDAAEDISSAVPDSGEIYMILLSIDDIGEDELVIEATMHFSTNVSNTKWFNPTTTPVQLVHGDCRKSVYDGPCGGVNYGLPDASWWEFQVRLNPYIYDQDLPLNSYCAQSGALIIPYGDVYYDWNSNSSDFWKGPYKTESLSYLTLNSYMNAAAGIYSDQTFPGFPNRHVYFIWYVYAEQEQIAPWYYYHGMYLKNASFFVVDFD